MGNRTQEQEHAKRAAERAERVAKLGDRYVVERIVRAAARAPGLPLADVPALAAHLGRGNLDPFVFGLDVDCGFVARDGDVLRATPEGRAHFRRLLARGGRNLPSGRARTSAQKGAQTSPSVPALRREEWDDLAVLGRTNRAAYDEVLGALQAQDTAKARATLTAALLDRRGGPPRGGRQGPLSGSKSKPKSRRMFGPRPRRLGPLTEVELAELARTVLEPVDESGTFKPFSVTLTYRPDVPDRDRALRSAVDDLVRRVAREGSHAVAVVATSPRGFGHVHILAALRNGEAVGDDWWATTGAIANVTIVTGWKAFLFEKKSRDFIERQGKQILGYAFDEAKQGAIDLERDVFGTENWTAFLDRRLATAALREDLLDDGAETVHDQNRRKAS